MRRLLPATPTMLYERMLLAAIFASVCMLLSMTFIAPSLAAASDLSWSELAPLSGRARAALTMGALGASLLFIGVSFALFAAIKINVRGQLGKPRYFEPVRRVGFGFAGLAVLLGFVFALVQLLP